MFSYGSDDGEEETRYLVGPEFFAEARLSNKQVDPNDEEYSGGDKVEIKNTNFNAHESEILKQSNAILEQEKETDGEPNNYEESLEISGSPYGVPNIGKYPLFPVAYDRFNYLQQNPIFLPPNSYVPIPIINQYLQRRSYNAALRYPQIISPYPQYYNPSNTYAPVRLYYAQ